MRIRHCGIITPYRSQAEEINKAIGLILPVQCINIKDVNATLIIMSTVDNTPTEFSDDPNLLNVAISRAKNIVHSNQWQ